MFLGNLSTAHERKARKGGGGMKVSSMQAFVRELWMTCASNTEFEEQMWTDSSLSLFNITYMKPLKF